VPIGSTETSHVPIGRNVARCALNAKQLHCKLQIVVQPNEKFHEKSLKNQEWPVSSMKKIYTLYLYEIYYIVITGKYIINTYIASTYLLFYFLLFFPLS